MDFRKEIHNIYREIGENIQEFDCLKTDELLSAFKKETNKYLENKNNEIIESEKLASLSIDIQLNKKEKVEILKKLIGYRYVDEIDSLHIGKYTRWIQKYEEPVKLSPGSFLTSIDYLDNGIIMTLKTWNNRIFKIAFDDCLVYQKLSNGEELILMTADYIIGK